MKRILIACLLLLSITAVAQKKTNSLQASTQYSVIDGIKEAPVKTVPKQKLPRYNFNRKRSKLSAPVFEIGIKATGFYSALLHQTDLSLNGEKAMIGDQVVGKHVSYTDGQGYHNQVIMPSNTMSWWSNSEESSHTAVIRSDKPYVTGNYALELRRVRYSGNGTPHGYFMNIGATVINNNFNNIKSLSSKQVFVPVGFGYIVPGDRSFHVEFSGSAVLGKGGFTGSQFDFSFAIGNVKFGPSFTYIRTKGPIVSQFSSPGVHLSIVPKFNR